MKRYIYYVESSAALKRKDLADLVEDHTVPIMEILAQLYLFPKTECENHWRTELYSQWYKVKLLKGNKLPEKDFLVNSTIAVNRHLAERILKAMIAKEYKLTPRNNYSVEAYLKICDDYFDWLCEELSKNQVVFPDDVFHKLDAMKL